MSYPHSPDSAFPRPRILRPHIFQTAALKVGMESILLARTLAVSCSSRHGLVGLCSRFGALQNYIFRYLINELEAYKSRLVIRSSRPPSTTMLTKPLSV